MSRTKTAEAPEGGQVKPAFREFEPHPLLLMFPTGSEEDISAMHRDVAENGVRHKIRFWKDAKGKAWLIDGTVRQAGAKRAFLEKVEADPPLPPVADKTGVDLQPEAEEFCGTIDDVLEFVKTTHVRKHYTPSQKAALGVQLYYYEYKKSHAGKLPKPEDEVSGEGAKSAKQLALQYGVNEWYIRIMRQLYREDAPLFDAVAMGSIPAQKAKAEFERKKAGNPPDPLGEEDGEADATAGMDAGEAAEAITDADGVAVPDAHKETFRGRVVFKQLRRELTKLKGQVGTMAATDGGAYIDLQSVEAGFNALLAHLHGSEPSVVCPECHGKGHRPGQRYDCPACERIGFLSRAAHSSYKKGTKARKADEKEAD